jgi:hypothetical protein
MPTEKRRHPKPATPFVFVLMPFAAEFDGVYQAIKSAAERAGILAERVDEQVYETLILERIYRQIRRAEIIVADVTGRNANVMYEVGYAHAIGRTVTLLTSKARDIPFDLMQYPHIVYGDDLDFLVTELQRRFERYAVQSPERVTAEHESAFLERLEFLVNDTRISSENTLAKAPALRFAGDVPTEGLVAGLGGKLLLGLDINNADRHSTYYGGAHMSLGTSSRVVRVERMERNERRAARRVAQGDGYMFWPDWRLHQLDPSEGMTYVVTCYSSANEWFSDIEPFVLHLHFKGSPLAYNIDLSVVTLTPEQFSACENGLARL